jgi:uncharacterized protein YcnI
MRRVGIIGALALALLLAVSPAWAHVTVQPEEAPAGAFFAFVVRVPNEREDASTTKVEVEFPPLAFVSFQDVEGWKRTVEMRTLEEPLDVFGEPVSEVVGSVTWSGGEIQPGEFLDFGFSARVPEDQEELEFPALQTYSSGEVVRWIGPPDAEEPAARVAVVTLGGEEGQGQLALLAELNSRVQELEAATRESGGASGGSSTATTVLSWVALGVALVALAVSLLRRRA